MEPYTYLMLMLASAAYPLAQSFEWRLRLYTQWRYLLPGILITGGVFIAWDSWFAVTGVWSFNPDRVLGGYLLHLPLEEWLFFLVVPYACVFIYEVLLYFFPRTPQHLTGWRVLSVLAAAVATVVAVLYHDHAYTLVTFAGAAVVLLLNVVLLPAVYQFRFWTAYLVCLVPFGVVNGLLTSIPVVLYNDTENLGVRVGTIPLDDLAYNCMMLLLTLTVYEVLRRRAGIRLPEGRPTVGPVRATRVAS
jgi:lycopene cyclase domain-containing protein